MNKAGGPNHYGTVVLNGANTFSGGVDFGGGSGTLALGHRSALGTGELRLTTNSGGAFFRIDQNLTGANAIPNPVRYFGTLSGAVSPPPSVSGIVVGGTTFTVGSTTNLAPGQVVSGGGFPLNTRITAINGNVVTVSRPLSVANGFNLDARSYNGAGGGLTVFTGAHPVEFSGPYSLTSSNSNLANATQTLRVANTGGVILSGVVRQETVRFDGAPIAPAQVASLIKTGPHSLTLTNANAYTGTTSVLEGALYINGDQTASTGAVTVSATAGSTVSFTTAVGSTILTGNSTGLVVGQSVSGPDIPAGSFITAVNGTTSITLPQPATAAGTVDYTLGAVTGTLGGSGIVGGSTTINAGAFLTPGPAANTPGNLRFNQALTLSAGATSVFDLDGTTRGSSYDAVDVTGTLTYGGTLILDLGATQPTETSYAVFNAGSRAGSLAKVDIAGAYGSGSLTLDGGGIWSGLVGTGAFRFEESTGVLTVSAPLTAVDFWRYDTFPGSTAASGPGANGGDPDGDGVSNLLEYAFGSQATTSDLAQAPAYAVANVGGQNYLTVSFRRALSATDVTLGVQASGDASTWVDLDPLGAHLVSRTVSGSSETIVVRDSTAIGTGPATRFLRLKVSTASGSAPVTSTPGVYLATAAPASSDTLNSAGVGRPAVYAGRLAGVNGSELSVAGSPGWTANAFAPQAGQTYFVRLRSGTLKGHYFTVTGNGANALTVETAGLALDAIQAGDLFEVAPYWTLGTLYPAAQLGTGFLPSNSVARQTELLVYSPDLIGTNRAPSASYFFFNGAWRRVGAAVSVSFNDTVLPPDSYLLHRNRAAATVLARVGRVFDGALGTVLATDATRANDNHLALAHPRPVTLAASNLVESGAFAPATACWCSPEVASATTAPRPRCTSTATARGGKSARRPTPTSAE